MNGDKEESQMTLGYLELDPSKLTVDDLFTNFAQQQGVSFNDPELLEATKLIFVSGMAAMHYTIMYLRKANVSFDKIAPMLRRFESSFEDMGNYPFVASHKQGHG